jgi:hypothetical protein
MDLDNTILSVQVEPERNVPEEEILVPETERHLF